MARCATLPPAGRATLLHPYTHAKSYSIASEAVMSEPQYVEQERSVLKWGGLGGMVGGIVLVIVFVIVAVFVGSDPNEPMGFPGIRVARTFEDGLYLAVMILWIPLFLALYRALRKERLAPALFGSALGIVGLVVLAAGALPHITTLAVSDLVQASGSTINNEAALELWKAAYAVFNALLTAGLILATIGVICLGAAMIKNPKFGKGIGWTSVVLGVAGAIAASVQLWNPDSPAPMVAMVGLILFGAVSGLKTYRLSRLA
jgi:hypothetical protein